MKVLNVGQLQGMRQVDLHSLLPSWDIGISLKTGRKKCGCRGRVLRSLDLGPPHNHHLMSYSSLYTTITTLATKTPAWTQKQNFESKAMSQAAHARVKAKAAAAFCLNPSLQRGSRSPASLQQRAAYVWYLLLRYTQVISSDLRPAAHRKQVKRRRTEGGSQLASRETLQQVLAPLHTLRFAQCHRSPR